MCCENKAYKKKLIFSKSSALLYDQIISPRTSSSSIEMPESGYNICDNCFSVRSGHYPHIHANR